MKKSEISALALAVASALGVTTVGGARPAEAQDCRVPVLGSAGQVLYYNLGPDCEVDYYGAFTDYEPPMKDDPDDEEPDDKEPDDKDKSKGDDDNPGKDTDKGPDDKGQPDDKGGDKGTDPGEEEEEEEENGKEGGKGGK